jgi:DNA-binding response OmpR family regulator
VLNCANGSVAYGYAISKNKQAEIVSCIGRIQPKACYKIHLQYKTKGISTTNWSYSFAALLVLVLGGFVYCRSGTKQQVVPSIPAIPESTESTQEDIFTLGSTLFDAANRTLITNDTTIDLTNTETRVLRIFAMSPNEAVERSRLQKEIWEDEGVIVGRSLDMFISKLRKKLELDPNIKIVVIRGKGYKLEISG